MHGAPSVSYPVGRCRDAGRILMVVWAVGAGVAGVACYQIDSNQEGGGWRQWAMLVAVAIAAIGVWRVLRAQAPGELLWDGQHWTLKADRERGGAAAGVHLDLQSLLLVRIAPAEGRAQWLWLERRAAPERWRDLRRALYSRAASPQPAGDAPATSRSSTGPTP